MNRFASLSKMLEFDTGRSGRADCADRILPHPPAEHTRHSSKKRIDHRRGTELRVLD
jgi:hypothetical protein